MKQMPKSWNITPSPAYKTLILAAIFAALVWPSGSGFGLEGTEDQIKGAMMVNFIKFIQWPDHVMEQTGGVITIGIFGDDRFGDALEPVDGRTVGGYRLSVRRVHLPDQLAACQVVYIPAAESHRAALLLQEIAGLPVLSIGESPAFLLSGGIIRFYMKNNHIRFEINQAAALAADLKISAKLFEIAATFD